MAPRLFYVWSKVDDLFKAKVKGLYRKVDHKLKFQFLLSQSIGETMGDFKSEQYLVCYIIFPAER